ncbi:MAG: hypothetical protein DRQ88_00695 [Epsilonproteobacteria bacterium]|nr:MAG: hypothetical protein DRQ89_10230 [Campylobacterota bacterium]RLA68154.1 MAG: hypothetical protein DRQ88_00695 [Campylobacterota bacterium]
MEEYPQDYFVKIENEEHHLGRITINRASHFNVEIDIVQKESKKIFQHVDMLFNIEDKTEAIDSGVQVLAKFLKKPLE